MWGFLHWGRPLILWGRWCLPGWSPNWTYWIFIYLCQQTKTKDKVFAHSFKTRNLLEDFSALSLFFASEDEGFSKRKLKGAHIAILGQMVQVPFCPVSSIIASSLPPNSCNLSVPLHSLYPCLCFSSFWNLKLIKSHRLLFRVVGERWNGGIYSMFTKSKLSETQSSLHLGGAKKRW